MWRSGKVTWQSTEGTDYGVHDVPLATKVAQVQHQLDAGTAVIVYDETIESCTIQPLDQRAHAAL